MRKLFKIVSSFIIIFCFVFPHAISANQGDSTPPELISLEVSPKELNVGDTLEVVADVTDDISGVKGVNIQFYQRLENGGMKSIHFSLDYNYSSNLWENNYKIKETDLGGSWNLYSIGFVDYAGNSNNLSEHDLQNIENLYFIINNPYEVDINPPTLDYVNINSNSFIVGEELVIQIKSTDTSGIDHVTATYTKPDSEWITINFDYDKEKETWIGKHLISPYEQGGVWEFQFINIVDKLNNNGWFPPKYFNEDYNFNFEVINEIGDFNPPNIESLEVSPREVGTNDTVFVKANIKDDLAGVLQVDVTLESPSKNSERTMQLYDKNNDGIWEGSYKISSLDEEGNWLIDRIFVIDKVNNGKLTFASELENYDELSFSLIHSIPSEENESTTLTLNSIEITPNALNVGDQLKVTADVSKDVKHIQISYSIFIEGERKSINISPIYNDNTNKWEGEYTVKFNDVEGTWKLDDVVLSDFEGDFIRIKPSELSNRHDMNFTIINPNEPFALESIEISPKEVDVGEKINIKAKVNMDDSLISNFDVIYHSPYQEVVGKNKYISLKYNEKLKLWVGEFNVEETDMNGIWSFNHIYIRGVDDGTIVLNREKLNRNNSNSLDLTINSQNDIDIEKTVNIYDINSFGSREKIGIRFFAESAILDSLANLSEGYILISNKNGDLVKAKISESMRYGNSGEIVFNLPAETNEGIWEVIEISLTNDKENYILNHFINSYNSDEILSYKFYIPSIEADNWIRTNLASKIQNRGGDHFYDDYLHLIANSSMSVNNFIERFKEALPPITKEVDYHKLLKYAYNGWGEWHEPFLYQWWKEGLIQAKKEPSIPIQVFSSNQKISIKSTKNIELYITEVLHYSPDIHNQDNKVTAYIKSPNGKEFSVNNFVYNSNFRWWDTNYEKGGWTGNFDLPNDALKGRWTIDRFEVKNGNEVRSYVNGIDFFNASIELTDGKEYEQPEEEKPPVVNPPKEDDSDNGSDNEGSDNSGGTSTPSNPTPSPSEPIDTTPPAKPEVNEINDMSKEISGTAEIGSTVTVKEGENVLYLVKVDKNGKFSIPVKDLLSGMELTITVTDAEGNVSEPLSIKVKEVVLTFNDVGSTYQNEISYLVKRGIIKGYEGNFFKPEQPTKRLQAIQMILREKGITDFNAPDPKFADIKKGDYGYEEIAKAVELGIISGKTDVKTSEKYFDPNGTLTRGHMAKVLTNAYSIKGSNASNFTDITPSDWYYQYVNILVANGIVTGYEDNTFKPNQLVSRKHFAVLLARYLNPEFK